MFDDLNEENFVLYSMKAYDKPNAITSEFDKDLKRVKYIKRLVKKYKLTGDLKERLILNHIIILGNTFGIEQTVRILFFKINESDYDVLKTFLLFLNYMPNIVKSVRGKPIISADITVDLKVGKQLRNV